MSEVLRVLFIEDSEIDTLLLVRQLRQAGYDVKTERVENEPDLRKTLEEAQWDVILSDYSMPHLSGMTALNVLKEYDLDIPFIVITGTVGEETAVTLMKSGAHDFFIKGRTTRLPNAIERELREAKHRREQHLAERSLQKRARQQAVIAQLGQQALTNTDPEPLIKEAVYLLRDALEIECVRILELLPDGNRLQFIADTEGQEGQVSVEDDSHLAYTLAQSQPVIVEDVAQETRFMVSPAFTECRGGISLMIPGRQKPFGILDAFYVQPQTFTQEDVHFLQSVANVLANAIMNRELLQAEIRAREVAEAAQRRMHFLAEASAVLAASLDHETGLTYVMRLAVPTLADWAAIVLLEEDGRVHSVHTVAKTQSIQDVLARIQSDIPFDIKGPSEIADVLRSGKSLLIPQVNETTLEHYAINADHLNLMHQLNLRSSLVVALQARGHTLGAISFNICQDGRLYDRDDLAMVEGLAHRISMAIDRARLYQDERLARVTLQARVQLQALISELGQQALTSDDLPALLDQAAALLSQTLGVEFSEVFELQPHKNRFFLKAGVGWREGLVGKAMISAGLQSQAGYTLLSSRPIIVEDLRTETRFQGSRLLLDHEVVSGVSVIIQGQERPWGVLGIHSTRARTFTSDDIYFVQSVANILGAALERARWYDEAQKTAALQERQRIARELHDAVSQTLFAANLLAESLPRLWEREPEKALGRLRQLHQLTRGAAAEMRVLLIELRPESIINADLSYLMTQLGYAMPGRQNMEVSVVIRGWTEQSLSPDAQVTFYRIAQESLNNIIKHGQASQARLRLVRTSTHIILTVVDNGMGFDTQRAGTGLGLKSMVERANSIGAVFQVKSRVGRGTQVKLVWPLP